MKAKVTIIDHPVIQDKLGCLRNKETSGPDFRRLMYELSSFLMYEASSKFKTIDEQIETPLATAMVKKVADTPIIVSIMRAGNGMVEGLLSVLPKASAGHIGIYRDKFINNTVEYFFKVPEQIKGECVFIADPLMATGDTAVACVDRLKQYGPRSITFLSFLVAPEGLEKLHHFHPDVEVFALHKEEGLNGEGSLIPGLGDAGNRLYQQ
ncbi:MAG: uracil phosphoribosyltransferase [Halobacteriovoraceae bacterium]|jgi:uracil phosphoribosyltransferase|nr:uracil phosphoribosyltransferase [Halobacteriovoraceae bacterium]MBT5094703.1 uracil phosphoribosyltransferase [Halobacteriovoraceae bacterium]